MNIFEYEIKKGTRYGCRGYLGQDHITGQDITVDKRGFLTPQEAKEYYEKEKSKFIMGEFKRIEKRYTFKEVYEEWLEVYRLDVKESTLVKTEERFRLHILPAFGDMLIKKITPVHIQKVLNEWYRSYKKYKYMYNNFSRIMAYALLHDYIIENPCEKVAVPKAQQTISKPTGRKKFFDKNELNLFLRTLKEHEPLKWYAMFRLFAFSGIRRGELLALTWEDIDFQGKTLSINKGVAMGHGRRLILQPPKSPSSIRIIGLDDETLAVLQAWRTRQAKEFLKLGYNTRKKDQLLFSNEKDNGFLNLSAPRNALCRICERHKLPMINIHGFRHTHCSLLFESGVPMKDVKERLGHSDIQTTMNIYTHVTETSRNKSAELFANYINF